MFREEKFTNPQKRNQSSGRRLIYFQDEEIDGDTATIDVPCLTARPIMLQSNRLKNRKVRPTQFSLAKSNKKNFFQTKRQEEVSKLTKVPLYQLNTKSSSQKLIQDFLYRSTTKQKLTMKLTVTKSLMNRKIVCRLRILEREIILKTLKSVNFQNAQFKIFLCQNTPEIGQDNSLFVGQMTYQFGIWQITDDGKYPVHNNEVIKRRFGSVSIDQHIFDIPTVRMLVPKVTNGQMAIIQANFMSHLFELEKKSAKSQLEKYVSLRRSKQQSAQSNLDLGCRQSKKNLVMKNAVEDNYSLILGRINDSDYRVDLLGGLSPFQAFCLCIAWLD